MSFSPLAQAIFRQSMYEYDPRQFSSLEEDRIIINHIEDQNEVIEKRIQAKRENIARLSQEIEETSQKDNEQSKKAREFWSSFLKCEETLPNKLKGES